MSPIRLSERAARLYYLVGGIIIAAIFAAALCAPAPQPNAVAMEQPQQEDDHLGVIAAIPLHLYSVIQDAPGAADAIVDLHTVSDDGTVIAHIDLVALLVAQHKACKGTTTTASTEEEE